MAWTIRHLGDLQRAPGSHDVETPNMRKGPCWRRYQDRNGRRPGKGERLSGTPIAP